MFFTINVLLWPLGVFMPLEPRRCVTTSEARKIVALAGERRSMARDE
jgi:hypothetical protein